VCRDQWLLLLLKKGVVTEACKLQCLPRAAFKGKMTSGATTLARLWLTVQLLPRPSDEPRSESSRPEAILAASHEVKPGALALDPHTLASMKAV